MPINQGLRLSREIRLGDACDRLVVACGAVIGTGADAIDDIGQDFLSILQWQPGWIATAYHDLGMYSQYPRADLVIIKNQPRENDTEARRDELRAVLFAEEQRLDCMTRMAPL